MGTVSSYWGEVRDVGSSAGRLQFCLLYCHDVNVFVFSQKSKLVDFRGESVDIYLQDVHFGLFLVWGCLGLGSRWHRGLLC